MKQPYHPTAVPCADCSGLLIMTRIIIAGIILVLLFP